MVVNMKGWIFKDIGFCEKMGEGWKKESLYAAGGAYYALLEMHLKVRDQRPSLVTPDAIHAIWDTWGPSMGGNSGVLLVMSQAQR